MYGQKLTVTKQIQVPFSFNYTARGNLKSKKQLESVFFVDVKLYRLNKRQGHNFMKRLFLRFSQAIGEVRCLNRRKICFIRWVHCLRL
jgi:hypothetical protein